MAITLRIEADSDALLTLEGTESATLQAEATTYISNVQDYTGEYTVTPKAYEGQVLATENKRMLHDVTVYEVPYYETSNQTGETVYIASEV